MRLNEKLFPEVVNENQIILKVYVIVDAAHMEGTTFELLKTKLEYRNLYMKEDAEALEEVAPYLVELKEDDEFTKWILQKVYGNLSCIFLHSFENIDSLAEHLRSFVTTTMWVQHPKKQDEKMLTKAYVRFYDPRVISLFCNQLENRRNFFAKFERIYIEDKFDAQTLWNFTVDGEKSEEIA